MGEGSHAAVARRVPKYCERHGIPSMVGYGQYVFYAFGAILGLLGAWIILTDL
jgi:hypothetical protein